MSKNLVIVESPAKAKTINKYLGDDYKVMASIGHIKDLPAKDLGVDVDNDFEPTYEVIPDKKKRNNKKTVSDLRKAAKASEAIYLAADPDREGEAICQHLAEELTKRNKKPVYRVMFNEITKNAIHDAFKEPKEINENLVNSQQTRRILDRLVGYKVSPILWKTIGGRLSAGRVQTVAVRIIVEREREIEAFKKTEYWSVVADLAASLPPNFESKLRTIDDKTVKLGKFDEDLKKKETHIKEEQTANEIVDELKQEEFIIAEIKKKEAKRNPTPPFITSKLQQDAARRFGFTVKRTMTVAQKLYEGVELGSEGAVGLITYMRTDSTRVSADALNNAREFIGGQFGDEYLPAKAKNYETKKAAQDAHEAIRPTDVNRTPESLEKLLTPEMLKLYTLIWQRFVASQMTPALFDRTTIDINAGRFGFRSTGSIQKFDGFLKVYQEAQSSTDKPDADADRTLPAVEEGEKLKPNSITPNQHFTDPPPRYSEATLVKTLEELGIGRPSTYASIMTTIQSREYVEKIEKRFHPTALGTTVNDLLVECFDDLFNTDYTARMESSLDEIEEGKLDWRMALRGFYDRFSKDLEDAKENIKDKKKQAIPTDEVCEKCNAGMVIKFGRYGQFLACESYPECKNTREVAKKSDPETDDDSETETEEIPVCELCGKEMSLKRGRYGAFYGCTGYPVCKNISKIAKGDQKPVATPVELDEECPKDGAKLVRRTGRFGEFVSCSNYPKCKYIQQEKIGMKCTSETCKKGEIVVKKSRRGKVFYGCDQYPDCDVVFWNKPIMEPCPECNAPIVLEKYTKRNGTERYCNNEECEYKISVDDPITPEESETQATNSAS